MKPSKIRYVLSSFFLVAVLFIFGMYLYARSDQLARLFQFSALMIVFLALVNVASALTRGLTNTCFYRSLNVPLSIREGTGLSVLNTLGNQLPFSGGFLAKGIYLKRKHKLAYTRNLPATTALYVCSVGVNGLAGLGGLAWLAVFGTTHIPILLLLGFFAMTATVIALWLPFRGLKVPARWRQRLDQAIEGWQSLSQNRVLVIQVVVLHLTGTLLTAAALFLAFRMLSQDARFVHCVLFSSSSILTRLVTVVPGGIGIREGIVAAVSAAFGFDFGVSAVAVGIDRIMVILVAMVLGGLYTLLFARNLTSRAVQPDGPSHTGP